MVVFTWLNDVFLKMTWLDQFFYFILETVFKLDPEASIFGILNFFLYDTIKIFILLITLIFLVSMIQSYFPPERTTLILRKYKGIKGNVLGALLGTLTPFCSCSSIPIFIGFTRAGLPIGITFSFLISSPLVDLASFVVLMSFLGWKIALAYVIVGIVLAVVGGLFMDKTKMERYLQDYIIEMQKEATQHFEIIELTRMDRVRFSIDQVKDIIKRVWIYILIGVSIGALIHGVIPQEFIEAVLGKNNFFSVFIATVVGIPMYADIFGTIPIAEALLLKGVGVGTVLAFMMAVTALSLPSLILLKQVVKPKLLVTFVTIITIGIIIIGLVFNSLEILL